MKSKVLYSTLAVGALAAALAVGGYGLLRPTNTDTSAHGGDGTSALFADIGNDAFGQSGLPNSSDKVSVNAWFPGPVADDGSRNLRVRLHVDQGWHVNANPASLESLIPTTVQARANEQAVPLKVSYPPGRDSDIHLDGTTVQVYEDNATINAVLIPAALEAARAAGALDIVVQAQSCSDEGICLPPSKLTVRLPWSQPNA